MGNDKGNQGPRRVDLVAGVVGWIEALLGILVVRVDAPAPTQREKPLLVDVSLERTAEIEEIPIMPDRLDQDERGGILELRARLSIPCEAIGEPALHDVDAIHKAAERREIGTDAHELGMVAVRIARTVVECHIPELSRPNPQSRSGLCP